MVRVSPTFTAPTFTATTEITTTTTLPPPPQHQSGSDSDLASRVSALKQVCASLEKRHKLQDNNVQGLSSKVFTLELRDLPQKNSATHSEQPVEDVPILDDVNVSDSKDTNTAHLPKIKTRPYWLKPVPKEDRPATLEPDWVIPPNELPETKNN
ncbi:hypothetical protein Tco_1020793 [Tanacetum coccineum]